MAVFLAILALVCAGIFAFLCYLAWVAVRDGDHAFGALFVASALLLGFLAYIAGNESYVRLTVEPEIGAHVVADFEHGSRLILAGKVMVPHSYTRFHVRDLGDELECSGHRQWNVGQTVRLKLFRAEDGTILAYDVLD